MQSFLDCLELRGFRGEVYAVFRDAAESESDPAGIIAAVEYDLCVDGSPRSAQILTEIDRQRQAANDFAAGLLLSLSLSNGGTR